MKSLTFVDMVVCYQWSQGYAKLLILMVQMFENRRVSQVDFEKLWMFACVHQNGARVNGRTHINLNFLNINKLGLNFQSDIFICWDFDNNWLFLIIKLFGLNIACLYFYSLLTAWFFKMFNCWIVIVYDE
jgi:hypothetical protein